MDNTPQFQKIIALVDEQRREMQALATCLQGAIDALQKYRDGLQDNGVEAGRTLGEITIICATGLNIDNLAALLNFDIPR